MQQLPDYLLAFLGTMNDPTALYEIELQPPAPNQLQQFNFDVPWPLFAWSATASGPAVGDDEGGATRVAIHEPGVMFHLYANPHFQMPPHSLWNYLVNAGNNVTMPTGAPDFSTAASIAAYKDQRNQFMAWVNLYFAIATGMRLDAESSPGAGSYSLVMEYMDEDADTGTPAAPEDLQWWIEIPMPGGHYIATQGWSPDDDHDAAYFVFYYDYRPAPLENCIVTNFERLHPNYLHWLHKLATAELQDNDGPLPGNNGNGGADGANAQPG